MRPKTEAGVKPGCPLCDCVSVHNSQRLRRWQEECVWPGGDAESSSGCFGCAGLVWCWPADVFSKQMVLKNGVQERALARRPGSIGSDSSSGHGAGC